MARRYVREQRLRYYFPRAFILFFRQHSPVSFFSVRAHHDRSSVPPCAGQFLPRVLPERGQGQVSRFAEEIAKREQEAGWTRQPAFDALARQIEQSKNILLAKLQKLKAESKSIAGDGAPATGNTIINYTGARKYLDCLIEGMPSKIGRYAPGSR